ncbi:FecR family protein [Spirochaeta dissipatitropha]
MDKSQLNCNGSIYRKLDGQLCRTVLLAAVLIAVFTAQLPASTAQKAVATTMFLEGSPQLVREGRQVAGEIEFGQDLYNLDLIRTDRSSLLELELSPDLQAQGRMTVHPSSEFYLAFDAGSHESAVHILRGSSSFDISRLPRGRGFSVHTAGAVMGVRGTSFSVDTSAQGEYLVSTLTGRVEVTSQDGQSIVAVPGQVVEFTVVNGFRALQVERGHEDEFRSRWKEQRLEVLLAKPESAIDFFSGRYYDGLTEFNQRFRDLMEHQDIIDLWILEDKQGRQSRMADQLRQKSALAGPLMRMTAHLVIFERTYYRAVELRDILEEASMLHSVKGASEFYADFDSDARVIAERLNMLRYIMRLYADRNNGRLPF